MECDTHEPRHRKAARLLLCAYLKVAGVLAAITAVTTVLTLWLTALQLDPAFNLYSQGYQAWVSIGSDVFAAASVMFGVGTSAVTVGTIAALHNWWSLRTRPTR